MKKFLVLIMCFCICFVFSGCKEGAKGKSEHSVDVEYYAKLGEIPECQYKLGDDANDMRTAFDEIDEENSDGAEEGHSHSVYSLMELEDYSFLIYKNSNYYYEEDNKVFAVVGLDTAYGFKSGTVILEVKEALSKFKPIETDGKYDKLFFMPLADNYTSLEYEFGKNTVIFVFQDNLLCATMVARTDYFVD